VKEKPPIIQLENVSFQYEPEQNSILQDISFKVDEGESILILGSSGAGKSTFLMTLAGFIPRIIPGELTGSVKLNGTDARDTKLSDFSHKVSTVLQNPESQLTCLTVEDEIAFALENFQVPQQEILERVDDIIKKTKMEKLRNREVYALSGGQQQRLAIASALVREPEVVILDEPLSNLDPVGIKEITHLIESLVKEKKSSIIMTAHDFSAFSYMFQRVIIIDKGTIIKDGPIREVLADVPLFEKLGLELPYYVSWTYKALGNSMKQAPLTAAEAYKMVKRANPAHITFEDPTSLDNRNFTNQKVVLSIKDLSIAFGKNTVVKNVNFDIYEGEIVALLGFNGSGKSTMALSIAGAIRPNRGKIEIGGIPLSFKKKKNKKLNTSVGYVFQYPEHQFIYESIQEEVMHGLPSSELERVNQELSQLGLDDPERHPYELSGGQKRRLSVKSSTIHEPDILILDEPTYGQDAHYREMIEEDLKVLNRKGKTIFIITHDMGLVDRIATRALIMHYGELVYDGTPSALFKQEDLLESYGLDLPQNHVMFSFTQNEKSKEVQL